MHELKIKKLHAENFKHFKLADFDFSDMTRISGQNGLGKSSLATAIMWTLFGVDYDLTSNPKVRREVDGEPVNDVPVTVEIVMDYDGKEVTVQKTQKRSINKNGEIADSNVFSVNRVNKTQRDFNAYFDFSFDDLLMCMNPAAFLAQKPVEMRKFLFKLPQDISDRDIVARFPELSGLAELLDQYTVEEITAMNKASITRLSKEISGYPGRIDEVNRQIVEDVDVAELELQINALKDQIADIERQESDTLSQSDEINSMQDNLLELRFKKTDIETKAYDVLRVEKAKKQAEYNHYCEDAMKLQTSINQLKIKRDKIQNDISRKKAEKDSLLADYGKIAADTPPEFVELPDLNENDLVCPTCGQAFPPDRREQIIADHEKKKKDRLADYQAFLVGYEKGKEERLAEISEQGRKLRDEIAQLETIELPDMEKKILEATEAHDSALSQANKVLEEMNKLPSQPDLSDNQEYEAICLEISAKEEAIRSINKGTDHKAELRRRKEEIYDELDSAKEQLAKVNNNVVLEDRLEELRQEHMQKEQAKADCERILDLLAELDKKKNEYLVADINRHFGRVTWKLWENAKNGNYQTCCVPMIDGFDIRSTANHGRVLEAQMDVALSIQKIVGINAPVLLDNAEALDSGNLKRILSDAACQMIVFAVSDSDKLEVEAIG